METHFVGKLKNPAFHALLLMIAHGIFLKDRFDVFDVGVKCTVDMIYFSVHPYYVSLERLNIFTLFEKLYVDLIEAFREHRRQIANNC